VFPNGSIDTLSNLTKDFAYYVVDVGVAYKEDTDAVVAVLREVGAELAADPAYAGSVLDALEVLGVDAFDDSQVTIKIRVKTLPLKQWEVGRELRRRIKKAFDARGIEIPFPHLSVYFGEASRPFAVRQAGGDASGSVAPLPSR
jgi:small conductance mechanosensitive channel